MKSCGYIHTRAACLICAVTAWHIIMVYISEITVKFDSDLLQFSGTAAAIMLVGMGELK